MDVIERVKVLRDFQPHNLSATETDYLADVQAAIVELGGLESGNTSLASKLIKPCSLHDENGVLLWMNAGAVEVLGETNAVDKPGIIELLHVHDRVMAARFLASSGSLTNDGKMIECRLRPMPGGLQDTRWIEMVKTGFEGHRSGHPFTLVSYRDVTRAKLNVLNALALREKTEEANAAKSRFLANISHELRTPLNAILGFSELLNSPLAVSFDEKKRFEYNELIHDSAKHLLNLLNSILDMSKIENGMYEIFPESFCVARCVENTTAIMNGQAAPRGIRLVTSGLESMPNIVADERAVRQILINLLSNAIKFSNDGDTVSLTAFRRARSVEFVISDQGVGISPDHLADLGKPFFQADSKYDRKFEGTGLGLSIVKGLVELHGGNIRFESVRGAGTKVIVSLPINCKPGKQVPASGKVHWVQPRQADVAPAPATSLKVLRNSA